MSPPTRGAWIQTHRGPGSRPAGRRRPPHTGAWIETSWRSMNRRQPRRRLPREWPMLRTLAYAVKTSGTHRACHAPPMSGILTPLVVRDADGSRPVRTDTVSLGLCRTPGHGVLTQWGVDVPKPLTQVKIQEPWNGKMPPD